MNFLFILHSAALKTLATAALGALAQPRGPIDNSAIPQNKYSSKGNILTINIEDLDDYSVKVSHNSHGLSNGTSPSPSANDTKSFKFQNQKIVYNSQESESYISPAADLLLSANSDDPESGKMRCRCLCHVVQKQHTLHQS